MNSLFEVANIYLHYRGGKHVGLAGLVGVILAIFIAIVWSDWIQPVINFVGLNRAAENMGIVVDGVGGGAATAYNVLIIYLFFCLGFSLIVGLGLLAFVYGSAALQSKFGATLIGVIIFVILSPILIWFIFSEVSDMKKEHKRALEHPDAYKEEQRLKKNKELMNYLIRTTKKDGKTNKVRKQDAIRYLHRIPSTEKNNFLVGITYDREAVLLFPRPFGTIVYGTVHRLIGVPLTFSSFSQTKDDPYRHNMRNNPDRYYMEYGKELEQWNVDEIEEFIYPKKVWDVQRVLKNFKNQDVYKDYVNRACRHYAVNKNKEIELNDKEKEIVSNVVSLTDYRTHNNA